MDFHLRAIELPQELIECVFILRLNTKKTNIKPNEIWISVFLNIVCTSSSSPIDIGYFV